MKQILGGALLLAVGLVVGWVLRSSVAAAARPPRQQIVSAAQAEQALAASSAPARVLGPTAAKVTPTDRVRDLAAITKRGRAFFSINAIAGSKLDANFIEMYGLTETEVAALNTSLAAARNRMAELELGQATAQMDDEKKELSVHVPPFPEAGGVVHDQVLSAFAAALGPERYAAFNVLSATGVEQAFGAYGLNDTTYTIKLTPSGPGYRGELLYVIETKYTSPTGIWGKSGSNLTASTIPDFFPTLAHFLPPSLIPPKK